MKIKSGTKTTEFLLALVAMILPVVMEFAGIKLPEGIVYATDALAGAYIGGRSYAKGRATQTTVIALPNTPVYGVKGNGTIEPVGTSGE